MDKIKRHHEICDEIKGLYERKNADYGDSFGISFKEEGMAMPRIRLGDKMNRFKNLSKAIEAAEKEWQLLEKQLLEELPLEERALKETQMVEEESLRDTLIDLANYAIMTIVEMELLNEN